MDTPTLDDTARALLGGDRGLLAMDESTPTCDQRFATLGIAQTAEMRRAYRDMIVTTPSLGESISGAILYDETIRQQTNAGAAVRAGAAAGRHRSRHQGRRRQQAARRLRRRGRHRRPRRPARSARRIRRHGRALREVARRHPHRRRHRRRTAAARQRARAGALRGALPGSGPGADRRARSADGRRPHAASAAARSPRTTLHVVFAQLHAQRVRLEGMLLKPNMVLPGEDCADQSDIDVDRRRPPSRRCCARSRRGARASPFSPAARPRSSRRRTSTR